MVTLGSAIRRARLDANLSQGEVGIRLGVSQGTISFWEREIEMPRIDHLVKLLIEFPALVEFVGEQDYKVIDQLRRIERALFKGKCACENCNCQTETGSSENNL